MNSAATQDQRPDTTPKGAGTTIARMLGEMGRRAGGSVADAYLFCENWLVDAKRASYGLAVARILLGVTFVGMALTNFGTRSYVFGSGAAWTGQLQYPTNDFATIWPFSLVNTAAHNDLALTALFLALIVCGVLFAIGYRTKFVMIPLFVLWVGVLSVNPYVQDQSDNLTRMSLIVMFFAAPAERWSVDARRRAKFAGRGGNVVVRLWHSQPVVPHWFSTIFHNFAVVVLAVQLCFVYAAGGLYKAAGQPWQDGTAVYAPLQTQQFGTWPVLSQLITAWGPMVAVATIGSVLVQVTFPLLLLRRGTRIFGLVAILLFHIAIGVLMGLPWFSLTMVALDAIFIRDVTWQAVVRRIGTMRSTVVGGRSGRLRNSHVPAKRGRRDGARPPVAVPEAESQEQPLVHL